MAQRYSALEMAKAFNLTGIRQLKKVLSRGESFIGLSEYGSETKPLYGRLDADDIQDVLDFCNAKKNYEKFFSKRVFEFFNAFYTDYKTGKAISLSTLCEKTGIQEYDIHEFLESDYSGDRLRSIVLARNPFFSKEDESVWHSKCQVLVNAFLRYYLQTNDVRHQALLSSEKDKKTSKKTKTKAKAKEPKNPYSDFQLKIQVTSKPTAKEKTQYQIFIFDPISFKRPSDGKRKNGVVVGFYDNRQTKEEYVIVACASNSLFLVSLKDISKKDILRSWERTPFKEIDDIKLSKISDTYSEKVGIVDLPIDDIYSNKKYSDKLLAFLQVLMFSISYKINSNRVSAGVREMSISGVTVSNTDGLIFRMILPRFLVVPVEFVKSKNSTEIVDKVFPKDFDDNALYEMLKNYIYVGSAQAQLKNMANRNGDYMGVLLVPKAQKHSFYVVEPDADKLSSILERACVSNGMTVGESKPVERPLLTSELLMRLGEEYLKDIFVPEQIAKYNIRHQKFTEEDLKTALQLMFLD